MTVRMYHDDIADEATAASLAQFETLYAARGWKLVPEGTPEPGEPGYVHPSQVESESESESVSSTDAADKPPRSRRRAADDAAATAAATDTED